MVSTGHTALEGEGVRQGLGAKPPPAQKKRKSDGRTTGAWLILLGLICILVPQAATAAPKPLSIKHWGTDEGLGPGALSSFLQTPDGLLWFGSEEGLMRFDGVHCTVFLPRNTPGLKAKGINALHGDGNGGLWAGTAGGGLSHRTADGMWTAFGRAQGLENEMVTAITRDSKGRLWVGTDGSGIFVMSGSQFQAFGENARLPSRHIEDLVAIGGDIWVGSSERLCRIRNGVLDTNISPGGTLPKHAKIAASSLPGEVWVGGLEGLYLIRSNQVHQVLPEAGIAKVQSLCVAPNGALWAGTPAGLVVVQQGKATRFTTQDGLSGNLVSTVFRDTEGSLWLATDVTGADQIRTTRFAALSPDPDLAHPVATGVYEDGNGALWIGGHHGLACIERDRVRRWTKSDGLRDNLVFGMCEGEPGEIWVGTFKGLNRLRNGRCEAFGQGTGLGSAPVWCLYRDRSEQVWVGTTRGLFRVHGDQIEHLDNKNSGLSNDDVRCIAEDSLGRLWVGTSYGLDLLDNGHFQGFFESASGRPFNAVIALLPEPGGALWVGTVGQGLFCYSSGTFSSFDREMGLYDNTIYSILEDGSGCLWMSCNRGVFRVAKKELEACASGRSTNLICTVFSKADGLPSVECNGTFQPAGWKSKDGRLWFSTMNGVAVVDPQRLVRNAQPPVVSIESVRVNGAETSQQAVRVVGPGVNEVLLKYMASSFIAPEAVRFRYRLIGLREDWLAPTEDRSARYTHLPAGDYRFEVMACNNDGVWSLQPAALTFRVVPFWWETNWFLGLAGLAAAGLVGGTARVWVVRKYRRRMAELERQHALDRERMRIATDLHDDVGSNLATIALLSEVALKSAESETTAELAEIQQLAQGTAEKMREIVWFVHSGEDELQDLVLRMRDTTRRLLVGLAWEFQAPDSLPRQKLSTEFKRHFFLIFKEALHNIHKHAKATRARVEVTPIPAGIELVIQDNGVGLLAGGSSGGLGLTSMRRRATDSGWELVIESPAGGGTRIWLKACFEMRAPSREHGMAAKEAQR